MKNNLFYILFICFLLLVARIVPHPPNFSPIIASALCCPLLFKDRFLGLSVPILVMFISDIFIGFHIYQFVIYLTLISISLLAPLTKKYFLFGTLALLGSIWFFLTTNFAVWLFWDFYPKSLSGLYACYVLAIPFFKNTLISSFLFTGFFLISIKYLEPILDTKT